MVPSLVFAVLHVLKIWIITVDIPFGDIGMGKIRSVQDRDEVLTLSVHYNGFYEVYHSSTEPVFKFNFF